MYEIKTKSKNSLQLENWKIHQNNERISSYELNVHKCQNILMFSHIIDLICVFYMDI